MKKRIISPIISIFSELSIKPLSYFEDHLPKRLDVLLQRFDLHENIYIFRRIRSEKMI